MTEFSTEAPVNADSWEGILANLRNRYPGQKDSVLFCLHKLHQNPELGLPDFRDEAKLHGIPMAGRALHSAKVLMGLAVAKPRKAKATAPPASMDPMTMNPTSPAASTPVGRSRRARSGAASEGNSIEMKVLEAVRQIQSAAGEEANRLRAAVQQAVEILQKALDQ